MKENPYHIIYWNGYNEHITIKTFSDYNKAVKFVDMMNSEWNEGDNNKETYYLQDVREE